MSTKFEIWQGLKDLTFIIPKNFSNLSQKSGGGRSQNVNINQGNDEEEYKNANGESKFIGLKSPDHLKKVCNMFRNNDYKANPAKYMQNLKHNINYENPDIFKGAVKTEILNKQHGNGYLNMKVFKILNPKKNGGTTGDSDDDRGTS